MSIETADVETARDEQRFAAQYVSLLDCVSRIAEQIQAANGSWSYVSEKLGVLQEAARRLDEIITVEAAEPLFPGEREMRARFAGPGPYPGRDAYACGPTWPVADGVIDPGRVRAEVAARGWRHLLVDAAHPVEQIEDRFAPIREAARAEKTAASPARP